MVTISGDEAVLIHKHTTLGQSELVAKDKIRNISKQKDWKSLKLTDNKEAKYDLKLFDNFIDNGFSSEAKGMFSELIYDFSDVFSEKAGDIGQCDVTTHKIQVEPGFPPFEQPN